jgi:8-oxo-dGTP diphosphatase
VQGQEWPEHRLIRVVRVAAVLLVDRRSRILLQERDEYAVNDPEKWGLVGGDVEEGEDDESAAYRELAEETGVTLAPGSLAYWREFRIFREASGSIDTFRPYVAATGLSDGDIQCHEGRLIVFVDPAKARRLDLAAPAAQVLPAFLDSATYGALSGRY